VRTNLAAAEVVNFDETGLRVEGMDAAGVLPVFTGIAVDDAFVPAPQGLEVDSSMMAGTRTTCAQEQAAARLCSPTPDLPCRQLRCAR